MKHLFSSLPRDLTALCFWMVPSGRGLLLQSIALRPSPEFLSRGYSPLPGSTLHHPLDNTSVFLILDSAASARAWPSSSVPPVWLCLVLVKLCSGWAEDPCWAGLPVIFLEKIISMVKILHLWKQHPMLMLPFWKEWGLMLGYDINPVAGWVLIREYIIILELRDKLAFP